MPHPVATVLDRLRRRPLDGHVSIFEEGDRPEGLTPLVAFHGTADQVLSTVLGEMSTADAVFKGVLDITAEPSTLTPQYARLMRLVREEVWALLDDAGRATDWHRRLAPFRDGSQRLDQHSRPVHGQPLHVIDVRRQHDGIAQLGRRSHDEGIDRVTRIEPVSVQESTRLLGDAPIRGNHTGRTQKPVDSCTTGST